MKKYFLAGIVIFATIIFAGFADNMKGIFIPSFKATFDVTDTKVSFILLASSIGYILAQYIGGVLVEKIGHRKTYVISLLCATLGVVVIYFSSTFYLLVLSMFLLTMGLAMGTIVTNTLIPLVFVSSQAIVMGIVHFSYGIGVTAGQKVAGDMLGAGFGFRQIYLVCGALAILILFMALFAKMPPKTESQKEEKLISLKEVLSDKVVILFGIAAGFYILSEVTMGTWFINYLKGVYNYSETIGARYVSIFFLLSAIGRFFGGFIAEKVGYLRTITIFVACALVFVVIGILGGRSMIMVMAISGIFFSLVFPTFIVAINERFEKNRAYILGVILTMTALIGNGLNFAVGYLNDTFGVYNAFFIVPAGLVISLITVISLRKIIKSEKKAQ